MLINSFTKCFTYEAHKQSREKVTEHQKQYPVLRLEPDLKKHIEACTTKRKFYKACTLHIPHLTLCTDTHVHNVNHAQITHAHVAVLTRAKAIGLMVSATVDIPVYRHVHVSQPRTLYMTFHSCREIL